VLEGQAGQNLMIFNSSNLGEKIDISANGQRMRFSRDLANITMDCAGIQLVQFNAVGGADTITVNDLSGTDVTNVSLDLSGTPGSGIGDGQADTVIVNGTAGNDNVTISGTPAGVSVFGLSATVSIFGTDPTLDQLILNLLGGDDVAVATQLQAGVLILTINGGPGNDVLVGSPGADVLLGGEGDDVLNGGLGQDILDGGPGDNIIIQ
jgi:Ca2+-binding RTX toxin-like protein